MKYVCTRYTLFMVSTIMVSFFQESLNLYKTNPKQSFVEWSLSHLSWMLPYAGLADSMWADILSQIRSSWKTALLWPSQAHWLHYQQETFTHLHVHATQAHEHLWIGMEISLLKTVFITRRNSGAGMQTMSLTRCLVGVPTPGEGLCCTHIHTIAGGSL